jgi:hypothetical protein
LVSYVNDENLDITNTVYDPETCLFSNKTFPLALFAKLIKSGDGAEFWNGKFFHFLFVQYGFFGLLFNGMRNIFQYVTWSTEFRMLTLLFASPTPSIFGYFAN